MHLREGEQILKIYHHHPTPFVYQILKAILATLPFFFLLFILQTAFSSTAYVIAHLVILSGFSILIVYLSLIYWLDKLVITNLRVIHIDWKYLTIRDEAEGFLDDIQDILTSEKGLLSYFSFFDYGAINIDTASSRVTLVFDDAPNPEGIRQFIYHVRRQ